MCPHGVPYWPAIVVVYHKVAILDKSGHDISIRFNEASNCIELELSPADTDVITGIGSFVAGKL